MTRRVRTVKQGRERFAGKKRGQSEAKREQKKSLT